MKKWYLLTFCLLLAFTLTGCGTSVKTYTYQEKRPDQDLSRGNKGYLFGDAPEPDPNRKTTRTMAGIDIALPDSKVYKERKASGPKKPVVRRPVVTEEKYVPEEEEEKGGTGYSDAQWVKQKETKASAKDMEYTIQKGDTLQKIAKKLLGKSSRWPEIFNANKNIIKDSSHIYPGQVIIIPGSSLRPDDEDIK